MQNILYGCSLAGYYSMIFDNRTGPYANAIKASIKPGDVILDIGTGTGFFAVLACKLGAQRVYAIEPDNVISVAQQVARDNGVDDRIEFIQANSTEVILPERANVIISDLTSVLPLFQHHIASIADARTRLLAPGGIQIPLKDTIWAALISDAEDYNNKYVTPWESSYYGCDLSACQKLITNTISKCRLKPEHLIAEPQIWTTIDYTLQQESNFENSLSWTIAEPKTLHGIGLWFDTKLTDRIGFSNAPGQLPYIYGNIFMPLSRPLELNSGDQVSVTIQANLVGDDYVWTWTTAVTSQHKPSIVKARLEQSTFLGSAVLMKSLQKHLLQPKEI